MNVKELIEWLSQFNEETIVEVVYHTSSGSGYYDQGGNATTVEFNPEDYEWVNEDTESRFCKHGHYELHNDCLRLGGFNE